MRAATTRVPASSAIGKMIRIARGSAEGTGTTRSRVWMTHESMMALTRMSSARRPPSDRAVPAPGKSTMTIVMPRDTSTLLRVARSSAVVSTVTMGPVGTRGFDLAT